MAKSTDIIWAKSTFNAWIGCTQVSPACDHCYAKAMFDDRLHMAKWGPGMPRVRTSPAHWKEPLKWNREAPDSEFMGRKGFWPVFVNSASDVFDNEVPDAWRAELFNLIIATPNLTWLLLTKRIGNAAKMLDEARRNDGVTRIQDFRVTPLHNVWLGATVVNQEEADRDIPKLLAVPAAKRFISVEPMLGPVDLTKPLCANMLHEIDGGPRLDWVIAGGESGPQARPAHPDWFRSLRDQCAAAGVPFLFKQWGEWCDVDNAPLEAHGYKNECWITAEGKIQDSAGGVDFFHSHPMYQFGTKAAGNHLDGRQHLEFPQP